MDNNRVAGGGGIHVSAEDMLEEEEDVYEGRHEDASQLQFGETFDNQTLFLSNSEVAVLLEQFQERGDDTRFSDAFKESLEYCQRFGGSAEMRTQEWTEELRNSLQALVFRRTDRRGNGRMEALHPFELTSLCNLQPKEVEEAKSLIPSLERFADEDVQAAVDEVKKVLSKTIGL